MIGAGASEPGQLLLRLIVESNPDIRLVNGVPLVLIGGVVATAAGRALARIDDTALAADAERLLAARATASGDIAVQLDRSLASVRAQQEIHDRLVVARNGVLARLESGTLGLESLVARVIELSAMAVSGPAGELGAVDQLGDELEGIRQGLAETEEVSRQALSAYQRNDPA